MIPRFDGAILSLEWKEALWDRYVIIPPTRSRKAPIPYDRDAYRARNLVERLWCRLKDWRRIATRYDKLAANYMAGVALAASIIFWCN